MQYQIYVSSYYYGIMLFHGKIGFAEISKNSRFKNVCLRTVEITRTFKLIARTLKFFAVINA